MQECIAKPGNIEYLIENLEKETGKKEVEYFIEYRGMLICPGVETKFVFCLWDESCSYIDMIEVDGVGVVTKALSNKMSSRVAQALNDGYDITVPDKFIKTI